MWNMMCDVMPTIAEDNISQRSSQFSGEDANFEQLMVSMLDERDKLMDSLREAQERLGESEMKLTDAEKERDSLQRQINANLPQVCCIYVLLYKKFLAIRRFGTVFETSSVQITSGAVVTVWAQEFVALSRYLTAYQIAFLCDCIVLPVYLFK